MGHNQQISAKDQALSFVEPLLELALEIVSFL